MRRRDFLYGAAAVSGMVPMAGAAVDVASIKSRGTKKVDLVYKSPHATPNGLQATSEGLWVVDQGKENCKRQSNPICKRGLFSGEVVG